MITQKNIAKGKYWQKGIFLIEGCTKVSAGCKNCWSETYETTRRKRDFNIVNPRYDRIKELGRGKPCIWSIWNDLFHEQVENLFIEKVLDRMWERPNNAYLIPTKRPERIPEWLEWSKRVHHGGKINRPFIAVGTSVENSDAYDRIAHLKTVRAAIKYLSVEPMLDFVTLTENTLKEIDWVIIGAESGANRRECKIEWVRDLVQQCKAAGVPVFVKQIHLWKANGNLFETKLKAISYTGFQPKLTLVKDINLFPEDLRYREYPKELKNER